MVGGALTPFSVQTLLISRQRATSCRARSDPAGSGSRGSAPAHVYAQPRKVTEHMVRGREPGELRLADGPALVVSPETQPPRSLVDTVIARSDPGPQVLWRIPRLALCVRYPHRLTRHLSPLKRIPKLQPRAYIQVPVETLSHHHHSSSIIASSNTICRRTLPVPHPYPHPASHRCPTPHLYPICIQICICISSLSLCSSAPSVQASHLPCPLLLPYVYSRRLLVVSVPLSVRLIAEIEMLLP